MNDRDPAVLHFTQMRKIEGLSMHISSIIHRVEQDKSFATVPAKLKLGDISRGEMQPSN
jgi:hypothetical protein